MNNNSAFSALGKKAFFQGLKNMGSGALDAAGGAINSAVGDATRGLRANIGGLGRAFTGESRGFTEGRNQAWNQASAADAAQARRAQQGVRQMQSAGSDIANRAGRVAQSAQQMGSQAVQNAQQMAKREGDRMIAAGQQGLQAAQDFGSQAAQGAQQLGSQAVQGAQALGNQAVQGLQTVGRTAADVGKTGVGLGIMGAQAVGSGLNTAGEAIGDASQQAFQATKDFGNQAIQGAQQLGNEALQTGQQAVDRAQQFGSGAYDAAAGGINSAAGSATQGLRANVGGLGRAFTGESRGFPAGRNQVYNEIGADIAAQDQRAQQGMQQMQGAFGKSGSAFDALGMEKEALAQGIAKGLRFAGSKLVGSGARAGRNAMQKTQNTLNTGRFGPRTDAERAAFTAAASTGKGRAGVGNAMSSAGKKINESPGLKTAINATGLAGLAGVGAGASGLLGGISDSESANANSPMGMGQYTGMGIQIPKSEEAAAVPTTAPAATSPAAAPAAAAKFVPDDKFLAKVMGSYDPKSSRDQSKAEVIKQMYQQSGGKLTPNQVYANQAYKNIDAKRNQQRKSAAFDALGMEKEALAQGISKLLGMGGKALSRSGQGAKAVAGMKSLGNSPPGLITQEAADAAKKLYSTGDRRLGIGGALTNAAGKIDDTPWLKNTINAAGVTGVGAGAYGIGSGRGERRGIGKGLTEGITIGARQAYQPDPGVLGRLGQLFTGTPQADMSALDAWLNENKDEVIKKILSRK